QEDLQSGSIVASSISMTGMSSLMGYTRWHWAHLSAVPFLTSFTGVLQLGQARISSSSASTGIMVSGKALEGWTIASWNRITFAMQFSRAVSCVFAGGLLVAGLPVPVAAQTP